MRQGLIVSAIGEDRPGIVDRFTGLVFEHGGNLEDSRMAILGGEFSLIALVTGSRVALDGLRAAVPDLAEDLGLTVQVRETRVDETTESGGAGKQTIDYRLDAVSLDHPGIVHQITHVLATHGVNVAALETRVQLAPTTGTPIFSLTLEAQVPVDLSIAKLRAELDDLATRENLDLTITGRLLK